MVRRETTRKASALVGAIYARYSSKFQHSLEDQIRACKEWAEKNGIVVPDNLIFVDRAVTGKSSRRQGLKDFHAALVEDRADVAIMFTTNRLYRKTYQSLAFVEEEIVDRGKRAVFVRSGPLDTDETDHWRQLLQMYALIDEFVVQMTAEHVRAAHEGLLLRCRVFGTVSFGFTGEPIPGETTRLGRPARRLIIDEAAAEWVKEVFHWFLVEHASIRDIVRRLNAAGAPLPPRTHLNRWTRLAVRRLLSNTRYRGWWEYGRTKAVWVNKPGYSKQVEREEPLAGLQIESLRIIDDVTWYAAQERLGKLARNAGRKPADGDRHSRPRVLNDFIFCPKHDAPLYVHGPFGKYMSCKACREEAEPTLYSLLPRRLALDLLCQQLAELILLDEELVEQAIEACRTHLERLTQPDPQEAAAVRREIERLTNQINFILDAPGETKQDLNENRERLGELRVERAKAQKRLAEIDEAARNPATLPETVTIQTLMDELATTFQEAADGDDPAELAALHDLIKDLTRGKIVATQQGEKEPHQGWLRLTFHVRLLDVLAHRCGFPDVKGDAIKVEIDIKRPDWKDQKCEEVKELYDKELLEKDIADQLDLHRSQVSMLLKHWAKKHGQTLPDGRKRRATIAQKQQKTPEYKAIADDVKAHWDDPTKPSVLEIARRMSTNDTMVWKALTWWHRRRGLPVPTAKDRRERIMLQAKQMFKDDIEIKDIASALGYSARGMKLLLKESFARDGETMVDGRSRRHHCRKAG